MRTHPDFMGQIASQHHHAMIAEARQRQLRREARPAPAPRTGTIARRLSAAIARLAIPAARVPDAS